jgi:LysM repeat protein
MLMACKPAMQPSTQPTAISGTLIPFFTPTPSVTPNLTLIPTNTPLPTVTPTPRIYTVKQGDTLSTIAWYYGINLTDLQAANPTVDPYTLKPGMTLVLPESKPSQSGTQAIPSATPVPVVIDPPTCYPSLDGSVWCFALVHNGNSFPVENITAEIRLSTSDSSGELNQVAITPLDVIAAGGMMPLVVHFASPVISVSHAEATLLTSIPVVGGDSRYITAKIDTQQITISSDGKTATASGNVILDGTRPANLIWVAAVAYDANGRVIGVRRWESIRALQPQTALPFTMNVYSMAGAISQVDLLVEARP